MSLLKILLEHCTDDKVDPDAPVSKATDHLTKHPEKPDIEDMFWLDEMLDD